MGIGKTSKTVNGKKLLSKKELAFVAAWEGDNCEAAKIAGYAWPSRACVKLMDRSHVAQAIAEKQQKILNFVTQKTAVKINKSTVTERLMRISEKAEKDKSFQPAVNALKAIAEIEGYIIRKSEDLTKLLEGKTDEEKEFFAIYAFWPSKEQLHEFLNSKNTEEPKEEVKVQ